MAGYLRLRQICLVAPRLEPAISDIADIMGLSVCYRDGNVAKYGLENALLPVDTILLEVVAPPSATDGDPFMIFIFLFLGCRRRSTTRQHDHVGPPNPTGCYGFRGGQPGQFICHNTRQSVS